MGKKSGRSNNGGDAADAPKATAFVLKVPMHCRCDGCGDKIRAAVKDLTLRCDGIVSLDKSALGTKGELSVIATADPERLRRRLRKATGKDVGLVFPKPAAAAADGKDAAAAVQALLAGLQQQQPVHAHHGHPLPAGTWNALQHGGYGQAAYPWVLQHQQAPPVPYFASYPAAASWGAYAAYPHDGLGGAYGGGGGWFGY
ncbi:unnamed protein product [Miscanthus lutarioriparius]|uniref:HMA domain-containing protein n=1 Tax=Miscanthus lutarioriparius TaxID=422564 RepID=A0A811PKS5_9POAL|nr:unnamed protein product [Miscanthus lutarioriparius]